MDAHDPVDPDGPKLTMVTTQVAAPGSAAEALRPDGRNVTKALDLLEAAARESTAEISRSARDAFLALTASGRAVFVSRMYVLDQSPTITDLDTEVRRELRHALPPPRHRDAFMRLLWSWWHGKVIDMLQGTRSGVNYLEVNAYLDDLKGQFAAPDMLPTTVTIAEFDRSTEPEYRDRTFVRQLHWVRVPNRVIQKAILDYYLAYAQSAQWLEDDLVMPDELDRFERALRDEWEREFDLMIASLPENVDDETKRLAGLRLLHDRLNQVRVRVRQRYEEPFLGRGVHHRLADEGRVGWHPDFERRVQEMLLGASS